MPAMYSGAGWAESVGFGVVSATEVAYGTGFVCQPECACLPRAADQPALVLLVQLFHSLIVYLLAVQIDNLTVRLLWRMLRCYGSSVADCLDHCLLLPYITQTFVEPPSGSIDLCLEVVLLLSDAIVPLVLLG